MSGIGEFPGETAVNFRVGRVLYEAPSFAFRADRLNLTALIAHRVFGLSVQRLRHLVARANEDNLDQIAGSLTFLTLLAIVPFITIGLALFAALPVFADFKTAIADFLQDGLLPEETSDIVMEHIANFAANAAQMTLAGIAVLCLTAFMLMQRIEKSFNQIWRVPQGRSPGRRLFIYTAALVLGPILIGGSLAATTFLVSASMGLLPAMIGFDKLILGLFPAVMTALAFTLLYHTVPNCPVRWRQALTGGVLAAAAFELMKILFGLYVAAFPSYQLIYGAFAAIPIFLIWIYLSWVITLVGALVVAAFSSALPHNAAP